MKRRRYCLTVPPYSARRATPLNAPGTVAGCQSPDAWAGWAGIARAARALAGAPSTGGAGCAGVGGVVRSRISQPERSGIGCGTAAWAVAEPMVSAPTTAAALRIARRIPALTRLGAVGCGEPAVTAAQAT